METRRRGDAGTRGSGDAGTRRHGDYVLMQIGLTQKLSETLISPCPLRPLWLDFPFPVRKSWQILK